MPVRVRDENGGAVIEDIKNVVVIVCNVVAAGAVVYIAVRVRRLIAEAREAIARGREEDEDRYNLFGDDE